MQIDVVWFPKEGPGGDQFSEKIFQGPLPRMTRDALDYIKRNFISETVIKHTGRAESTRVQNFPYDAIEEAIVNAVYHRGYGVRAMAAVCQASVPWCSIIVRKVFGVAGAAHQNSGRYNLRYVWPSGEWGSLPIAGGLEAAYKADIEAAADPAAKIAEIEKRLKALTSPFRSAESFIVEEIIDPRDTRRLLCEFADLAAPLRTPGGTAFGIRP